MVDSNKKIKDFSDTLDEMLNEAESLMKDDDLNEEDIMDQLIMENVFDVADEEMAKLSSDPGEQEAEENSIDIDEKSKVENDDFSEAELPIDSDENEEPEQSLVDENLVEEEDEFSETDPVTVEKNVAELEEVEEVSVDDLLDSVDESTNSEQQEPLEIRGLDEGIEESLEKNGGVDESKDKNSDVQENLTPDSLMTSFDISSDDNFSVSEENVKTEIEVGETSADEEKVDLLLVQNTEEISKASDAIDELSVKINLLVEENESLKQQITVLTAHTNQEVVLVESLDELKKEQKSIKRRIKDSDEKTPILTYVAIGLAGLSLLIGGGLGTIGYGAKTEVEELSELVTTLDEETDALVASSPKVEIDKLNKKINLLETDNLNFSTQLEGVNNTLESSSLKPIVDELVEQNGQSQQTIDKLLVKVNALEKRKFVAASVPRKKTKKIVKEIKWAVNLVSFKQKWYAKSKAAEFEKKGVSADVLQVRVKGEDWFRLRVKGFKSKYEASAYAVKVKKTLNLSSVWVTKI